MAYQKIHRPFSGKPGPEKPSPFGLRPFAEPRQPPKGGAQLVVQAEPDPVPVVEPAQSLEPQTVQPRRRSRPPDPVVNTLHAGERWNKWTGRWEPWPRAAAPARRRREPAPVLPDAPARTTGPDPEAEHYRQFWVVGGIEYDFTSEHGYRVNHHKKGKKASLNIRELGTMNDIERAILRHLTAALPAAGTGGTRSITVGQPVEYRFYRQDATHVGIGTYYRPDPPEGQDE